MPARLGAEFNPILPVRGLYYLNDSVNGVGEMQQVPLHAHHFHQLDILLSGSVQVFIDEKREHELQAGECLCIPPLTRHRYANTEKLHQASFKFSMSAPYWSRFSHEERKFTLSKSILQSVRHSGEHYNAGLPYFQQECISVLNTVLIYLLQTTPELSDADGTAVPESRHVLWGVIEKVMGDPYGDWTVESMAEHCRLSVNHFSRQFKNLCDKTPQRFLMEIRLQKAARDLVDDESSSIKSLADQCGYATVHSFTRSFKQMLGMSPAAYRESRLQGHEGF